MPNSNNQSKTTLTHTHTYTQTLPDHLIIDHILPRLPVKTLIKFTTVCKSWQTTIYSLSFTKSHLTFTSLIHPQILLLTKPTHHFNDRFNNNDNNNNLPDKIYLLPYNNTIIQLDPPLVTPTIHDDENYKRPIKIVGCCNGLVCLLVGEYGFGYFCVWNPATREFSEIANCVKGQAMCTAFGYVPKLDDYHIVSSFTSQFDVGSRELSIRFYVYSLREGEWKRASWLEEFGVFLHLDPVVVDGVVYFEASGNIHRGVGNRVFGFELGSERVEEIGFVRGRVFGLGGRLMFCCRKRGGTAVYVMKKEDGNYEWEEFKYFDRSVFEFGKNVFFIEGEKFLIRRDGVLKVVDSSLDECEIEDVKGFRLNDDEVDIDSVWNYSESLVSPFTLG